MEDFAALGIKVDSTQVKAANKDLVTFGKTGTQTQQQVTRATDHMNKGFGSLRDNLGKIGALFATLGVLRAANEIKEYADSWQLVNNQLRQVTNGEADLIEKRTMLLKISRETNADLEGTTRLYAEMYRSTRDLGTSSEDVARSTLVINNLFKAGGRAASETAGAVRQLNQGFASGTLRGEEFNSVAEGAPRILDALAVNLRMTRGELREFAATGGISAQVMIDAMLAYEDTAQAMADLVEETFGQKMVNAKTNVTEFVGESNALNDSVGLAGDAILLMSENLDIIGGVAAATGLIFSTRFAGPIVASMAASTKAQVEYITAAASGNVVTLEGATATAAKAAANEAQAATELAKARATASSTAANVAGYKATLESVKAEIAQEQLRLRAQITDKGRQLSTQRMAALSLELAAATRALTAAEAQHAVAATGVATAETRATAATVAATNARGAATLAMRAYTAATTLARGALSLVGGPGGAALIAAGALVYFAQKGEDATERTARLRSEVDALSDSFSNLTAGQLQSRIDEEMQNLEELGRRRAALTMPELSANSVAYQYEVEQYKKSIAELDEAFEQSALTVAELARHRQAAIDAGLEKERLATEAMNEEVGREIVLLREKIALVGKDERTVAIATATSRISTKVKEEDRKELIRLIGVLYDAEQAHEAEQESQERAAQAREKAKEEMASYREQQQRLLHAHFPLQAAQDKYNRSLGELYELYVAGLITQAEWEDGVRRVGKAFEEEKNNINGVTAATKELERETKELEKTYNNMIENIQSSWADTIYDTLRGTKFEFDNLWESVLDGYYRMIAEMMSKNLVSMLFGGKPMSLAGLFDGVGGANSSIMTALGKVPGFSGVGSQFADNSGLTKLKNSFGIGMTDDAGNPVGFDGKMFVDGLKTMGLNIAASYAGGKVGNSLGESLFDKEAESNIAQSIGTAIGTYLGGPIGSFVGSTLGSMLDVAAGGDGYIRQNAGMLVGDTPGAKAEHTFAVDRFDSGLQVTGFARREDRATAEAIMNQFRGYDSALTALVKELGGNLSVESLAGLNQEATPGSSGTFLGSGRDADLPSQINWFVSQLTDHITGLDQALLDSVRSATSAEEVINLLSEAVVKNEVANQRYETSLVAVGDELERQARIALGLTGLADQFRFDMLSDQEKLRSVEETFESTMRKAMAGDLAASEQLAAAADAYARQAARSDLAVDQYNSIMERIITSLDAAAKAVSEAATSVSLDDLVTQAIEAGRTEEQFRNDLISKGIDPNNVNMGRLVDGSHANGLDYVPFDGYIAQLHRGERVVPSDQVKNDAKVQKELTKSLRDVAKVVASANNGRSNLEMGQLLAATDNLVDAANYLAAAAAGLETNV